MPAYLSRNRAKTLTPEPLNCVEKNRSWVKVLNRRKSLAVAIAHRQNMLRLGNMKRMRMAQRKQQNSWDGI